MPMASSGHNGINETHVGMSNSISLSFTDTESQTISVQKSANPIDIWIPRDKTLPTHEFQFVNATALGGGKSTSSEQHYLPSAFNIKSNNASVHIELKPLNFSIGYLILVKFGYTPRVNSTHADYDYFKIFCPGSST